MSPDACLRRCQQDRPQFDIMYCDDDAMEAHLKIGHASILQCIMHDQLEFIVDVAQHGSRIVGEIAGRAASADAVAKHFEKVADAWSRMLMKKCSVDCVLEGQLQSGIKT